MAQEPITRLNYDSTEVYTMQYISSVFTHPSRGEVALVVVRASSTGTLYRIAMHQEYTVGIKPGDIVIVAEAKLR